MNPGVSNTHASHPTGGDEFDRVAQQYVALVGQKSRGKLSPAAFGEAVAKLRVQDRDGSVWQIVADTGAWTRWNGQQWIEQEAPRRTSDGEPAIQPTLFAEFEKYYREAVSEFRSGELSQAQFRKRIERLTIQDPAGWWQIRPSDGHWLKWNGTQWLPDNPPREQRAAGGPLRKVAGLLATSAKDEAKSVVGSFFRIAFQQVIGRVVMMVAAYFIAVNWHGYLLGTWNEGKDFSVTECAAWLHFNASTVSALNQSLPPAALVPPSWSLHAIWGSLGMVIGSVGLTFFRRGPIGAIKAIVMMPVNLWQRIRGSGLAGVGAILIGAGAAVLASHWMPLNPQAKMVLAASSLIFGVGLNGQLLSRFLFGICRRVLSASLQSKAPLSANLLQLALIGVSPGLYLAYKLSPSMAITAGALLLAAGAVLTGSMRKPLPQAAATFMALLCQGLFGGLIVWLLDQLTTDARADDGGKSEYMGPPEKYWKDNKEFLVPPSGPAGVDAAGGVIGGGDIGGDKDKDDPKNYSYSLVLSPRVLNYESPYPELTASARVDVFGPDPVVCANLAAKLTAAIGFSISGNCASWFDAPRPIDDVGAKRVGCTASVPDEAKNLAGPHAASLTATVDTPVGQLSRSCLMTVKVVAGYELSMDQALTLTANDAARGFRCGIICTDSDIDSDISNALIKKATPSIKFEISGPQAHWLREGNGGPGVLKGEIVGETCPEIQTELLAEVPVADLLVSPAFNAQILASAMLPGVGSLSTACAVEIGPPEWFIEARWVKQELVLDGKDAAEFEARLLPMLSDKLALYGGEEGNQLNAYLEIRASGANAGNAVVTEKEGSGGFRAWSVTFSATATECPADTIDLEIVATVSGSTAPQPMQVLVSGKPRLEVTEKSVALLAGGDPVAVHAQIKDGGTLDWSLHLEILNLDEVEPTGPPEAEGEGKFLLQFKAAALEPGDLAMRNGTLKMTASATNPTTGETIETDPVEVSLKLSQNGMSVSPSPVKLPLDPTKEKASPFRVRVLKYNAETQAFEPQQGAMQALEMEDWEDGNFTGGGNIFKGAGVELAFVRFEGSGATLEAVWSAKQKVQIPASQLIDAVRLLRAPGDYGDQQGLFEVRHTFAVPVDPAALQAEKIRIEQDNCRKTLRYLADSPQKTKFSTIIDKDARNLGAEGLYHLRHEIWEAARQALMDEAESYLQSARVLQVAEDVCNWTNYLSGLIVNAMSSVLVPFPGDMAIGLLYQAIPDLVIQVAAGKSAAEWAKGWAGGLLAGAPGMAVDIGLGQVASLEDLVLKGYAQFHDYKKAAGLACIVFWEVRFVRYQVTSKPDGEPFSLKESVLNAMRDLAEEIVTTGIGKATKFGKDGVPLTGLHDPYNGYDPKDGRVYNPTDTKPDVRGMPDKNVKAAQDLAAKHGVDIYIRPTNPASKKLLGEGAHPKPETIKTKTINELDIQLGRKPDDLGKVGYFDPGAKPPPQGDMPKAKYDELVERFNQRKAEYNSYKKEVAGLKDKGHTVTDDGVILHPDGKPYTGDHDIYDIRNPDGSKPTKAQYDAVMNDLKKPPFSAQHDGHRQWDYSHLDKTKPKPDANAKPGDPPPKSKWDKAHTVDSKILDSHSSTTSQGRPGEALIKVAGKGGITGQHANNANTYTQGGKASQSVAGTVRHDQNERNQKSSP